jgi:hypothetical protein
MLKTILVLIVVAIAIYLLKRRSDKEIAKPAPNGGLPPAGASGGTGTDTTIRPGDPGYDDLVNTAKGAQGPGPNN